MTKLCMILAILTGAVALVFSSQIVTFDASAQGGKKPQDTYVLASEAKLGTVKFSHVDHITKNRSIESSQVTCVECHHTAQPAADAAKHPPLKTAWPADRATTLTMELAEKDANAVGAPVATAMRAPMRNRNCCRKSQPSNWKSAPNWSR